MSSILDPKDPGKPSGVILNDTYIYSREDVLGRLEEIHKAALKFTFTKDREGLLVILTTLITEDFYERFRIDYWNDVTEYGTRFRDLLALSLMFKQLKTFLKYEATEEKVTFEMGSTLMQEIANMAAKLYKHRYEK